MKLHALCGTPRPRTGPGQIPSSNNSGPNFGRPPSKSGSSFNSTDRTSEEKIASDFHDPRDPRWWPHRNVSPAEVRRRGAPTRSPMSESTTPLSS
ncbi:hypothetical protein NDU88_005569 [Pleurodeles waltl]|uniref:Uncharacterized protein n=1 Tax=Pleurodeles waltl TaxID=8319 RepID=A0AAV7L1N7_PLEWA|nr:hypothetical protein NDU88_005569 [Pleurodeles waltl]